jgi:hypothetical protein
MKDAEVEPEIEDVLEGFNQPTHRGMRVNGVRVETWYYLLDGRKGGAGPG